MGLLNFLKKSPLLEARTVEIAFDKAEANLTQALEALSIEGERAIGCAQDACFNKMLEQIDQWGIELVSIVAGARAFTEAFERVLPGILDDSRLKWQIIELGLRHARLCSLLEEE